MSHLSGTSSVVERIRVCVLFVSLLFTGIMVNVMPVHAQLSDAQNNVQEVTEAAGINQGGDLIVIIGRIINIFLGFLGVVFLVLMLYAGYLWMTAQGDPEKVKKAQTTIRNAIIGLILIASAWAITAFILKALSGDGGGFGGFNSQSPPPGGLLGSSGSLGNGIIESHLPPRNATNVPRNTPVIITFKEPIKPESFIDGWSEAASNTNKGLNAANIKIYRTDSGPATALASNKAYVNYTKDLKTYVIKPIEYLGSPTNNVGYTVELKGGKTGIQKADGNPAFSGSYGNGYNWQFEVSTLIDLTPPIVTAAIPQEGGQYARNIIVQIHFNEAVDPTAATGKVSDGFTNMQVLAGLPGDQNPVPVNGEFKISNQYQTVEFIPSVKCGTNSCGKDIFCLPGKQTVQVSVKAATLDPKAIPQAQFTNNGYDGVVDVAGNSLDGNKDQKGQGPPTDNYIWSFGTTDDIKLSPPKIETTIPAIQDGGSPNVPLDLPVTAKFDSLLQASTLNTDNAKIDAHGKNETNPDTFWWTVGMKLLTANGAELDPKKNPPDVASKAALVMTHRPYLPSGTGMQNLNFYDPYILSGVQDAYQNCFNPAGACGPGTGNPHCCTNAASNDPKGCKPVLHP